MLLKYILYIIGLGIHNLVFILVGIAFFTLLERKWMSSIQRRKGPNIHGIFGILQPFADGLKLLLKESTYTSNANIFIFFLAPVFTFFCSLFIWFFIPYTTGYVLLELPFSILFLLGISSLGVHGIIFSGWSSNSKYAFLGSIRSASQMISYEISISSIYISVIMVVQSFSIADIVDYQKHIWLCVPLVPFWILYIICTLAESNRTPFDLPEAEAELVAGYNVEYSAMSFALFFLAEYGNLLSISCISTLLFFGGWYIPYINWINPFFIFIFKICINISFFLWTRACLPRYRFDHLLQIGWKRILPICFVLLMIEACLLLSFNII